MRELERDKCVYKKLMKGNKGLVALASQNFSGLKSRQCDMYSSAVGSE